MRDADQAEALRRGYLAWLLDQPECNGIVQNTLDADTITAEMLNEGGVT